MTMRKITFFTVLALLSLSMVCCNSSDDEPIIDPVPEVPDTSKEDEICAHWQKEASNSTLALVNEFWNKDKKFFNTYAGKADTSAQDWCYWPQAHAMDVIIDAYIRTENKTWKGYFDAWYEGVKQKSGGSYFNDFVDDMEWICLTMIRLYEQTGDKKFINTAQSLWDRIKANWNDTYSGGGIAWKQSQPASKNACSNGPAGIIAARMYQLNGKKQTDLDWAKKIYDWQTEKLVNAGTGAVYDHIVNHDTGERKDWFFTYNQGTYMGMAHELYNITGEKKYLDMAVLAANYCITNLIDKKNNILKDEGARGDGALFKAVFVRYFVKLVLEEDLSKSHKERFVAFFNNNATVLNEQGTSRDYLYNGHWASPGDRYNNDLGAQVSGCTMIEAKALYERELKAQRDKQK